MKIRTYADGYGMWHAVVPATGSVPAQRRRARRAIAAQVRQRQGEQGVVIRLGGTPPMAAAEACAVRVWGEV